MTKAEYSQRTHIRAHSWDTFSTVQHDEHVMCRIRHTHNVIEWPHNENLGQALERELSQLRYDWAMHKAGLKDQLELPF